MKFTVNRPAFCEALKTVMNVGKSSLLTRISGIYLYADASKRILELIGTDAITSVVKRIRNVDIKVGGEIILPPIVLEILKRTKEESKCYMISGSKPVLKQISGILKANGQPTVSYPLKKTEKALKRGLPVVLVDCSDFTDDWRLFQEYRWFRVPANFKEEAA